MLRQRREEGGARRDGSTHVPHWVAGVHCQADGLERASVRAARDGHRAGAGTRAAASGEKGYESPIRAHAFRDPSGPERRTECPFGRNAPTIAELVHCVACVRRKNLLSHLRGLSCVVLVGLASFVGSACCAACCHTPHAGCAVAARSAPGARAVLPGLSRLIANHSQPCTRQEHEGYQYWHRLDVQPW